MAELFHCLSLAVPGPAPSLSSAGSFGVRLPASLQLIMQQPPCVAAPSLAPVRGLLCFISYLANTRQLHLHKCRIPFECRAAQSCSELLICALSSLQCSLPRGKRCAEGPWISYSCFCIFCLLALSNYLLVLGGSCWCAVWPLFSLRLLSAVGLWLSLLAV